MDRLVAQLLRLALALFLALYGLWVVASAVMRCGNIDCTDRLSDMAMLGGLLYGAGLLAMALWAFPWFPRRRQKDHSEDAMEEA